MRYDFERGELVPGEFKPKSKLPLIRDLILYAVAGVALVLAWGLLV